MVPVRCARAVVALLSMTLSACAVSMPTDPHGTLDQVTGGVMRVGATDNSPWVEIADGTEGEIVPAGTEAQLIENFAASLDADISWMTGSEASVVAALERGELDMVVGGFDDQTPWSDKAAMTVPYTQTVGPDGPEKHVMLVRMGENRFLVTLERFLLDEGAP